MPRVYGVFMRYLVVLLCALSIAVPARAGDDPRRTPVVVAVERATPAVVTVTVEVAAQSPFFAFRAESRASEGSGVIIDASGLVLTNAHVISGAQRITVHLSDTRMFEAAVVAQDSALDLALLRVDGASGLPTIPLGDSDDLMLGEPAIAIGNPFGLGLTVSTGVIASTRRDMNVGDGPTQTYIQTDAAINPGNSGGALVNIHGQLIGINTFIHSAAEGIGFAIPVNRARKIADDLLAFGRVQVPWLGVSLADVGPRRLRSVPDGAMVVQRLDPAGPAARAGVQLGDVIYELDGHKVATRADLNARLAEANPGVRVRLGVLREQRTMAVEVATRRAPEDLGPRSMNEALQIQVAAIRGGLEVTEARPQGVWARAGLRVGDVILGVDGSRARTPEALEQLVGAAVAQHRASAWFTVARGQYRGTLELSL